MLSSTGRSCAATSAASAVTSSWRIWRPSGRGCTVRPRQPCSRHTRAAASGSGSRPPREFRSTATLLRLTLSTAIVAPPPSGAAQLSLNPAGPAAPPASAAALGMHLPDDRLPVFARGHAVAAVAAQHRSQVGGHAGLDFDLQLPVAAFAAPGDRESVV